MSPKGNNFDHTQSLPTEIHMDSARIEKDGMEHEVSPLKNEDLDTVVLDTIV